MIASKNMVATPDGVAQVPLSAEVIQHVLGFLGSLARNSYTSGVLTIPHVALQYVIVIALSKDKGFEMEVYPNIYLDR